VSLRARAACVICAAAALIVPTTAAARGPHLRMTRAEHGASRYGLSWVRAGSALGYYVKSCHRVSGRVAHCHVVLLGYKRLPNVSLDLDAMIAPRGAKRLAVRTVFDEPDLIAG
jgi:hypothetical protein